MKIDGRKIARQLLTELKNKIANLDKQPTLSILQVGTTQESSVYISEKKRVGERIGVKVIHDSFSETASEREIIDRVEKYNGNPEIHGIIIQLPLPPQINSDNIISNIASAKDVDGFLPNSPYQPPVACAVFYVLNHIFVTHTVNPLQKIHIRSLVKFLQNKIIIIIGRGRTGGRPIMQTFNKMGVPYIFIHSQTKNPAETMRTADIIISCVGKPRIVTPAKIKNGVSLIGVGVFRAEDGKLLHGDYEEAEIKDKAAFYTPTPGGIGPLTVACLMKNVVE